MAAISNGNRSRDPFGEMLGHLPASFSRTNARRRFVRMSD